ncbi:MAG TPA: hypothetical protein VK674_02145 [Candidatus Limnocylindria bacterium]|nr:hypothetical protein [Candidatus Limnocylindria bacterium]
MATTTKKSTTKAKTKTAKTKTTKKVSAKTAVKTTRATAAKRPSATATIPKAAAKKTQPGPTVAGMTIQKLRSLHVAAIGIFLLLAVAAGALMNTASHQLTLGYLAKDELASTQTTVFAPAVQAVYDIELRWAVVGIMLASMIFPVLYLTRLQKQYAEYLQQSRMWSMRWIDLAITGALMTEVVALVSGVSDLPTLKLIGGMVAATALLGLIAERQNNAAAKPVRSAYYVSLFTGVLPWLLIASYAVATVVYGTAGVTWYVYALYAAVFGGFLLQARNQHMEFGRANFLVVERNYIAISLLTKAAFAGILVIGLAR